MSRNQSTDIRPDKFLQFLAGVLKSFHHNNGLLLAGAIAYYTLLSIVPALALILLLLSGVIEQERLLSTLHHYLTLMTPNAADTLLNQVRHVIARPELVGGIGGITLLLFSGLAFRMTGNALQIIFVHRGIHVHRNIFHGLILPYLYVFALAVSIALIVTADAAYAVLRNTSLLRDLPLPDNDDDLINFMIGFSGEALLLMSFYLVMPVGRTTLKHAALGGISAAFLWEIARQLLTLWYTHISQINMIYGTFATVVILLLIIEAGAVILLLGAQVIANYEKGKESGL